MDRRQLVAAYGFWPHVPPAATPKQAGDFAIDLLAGATFIDEPGAFSARQDLPWDSEMLGLKAARVAFVALPDAAVSNVVGRTVQLSRDEGYGYLFTRVDARDLRTIQACEKAGFVTVDVIVSLYADPDGQAQGHVEMGVREASPSDADIVERLVDATLSRSRFHDDPLVGEAKARALYRAWARNSVNGLNQLTLIADIDSEPVGFLSVKDNASARRAFNVGYGRIELVGVESRHRGKGVVQALMGALFRRAPRFGWGRLGVGTQAFNAAAVRSYEKAGFKLGDAIVSMRWREDDL